MLSVIQDHRDKSPHYPWEFPLSHISIICDRGRIIVITPSSREARLGYEFKHSIGFDEFLAWFEEHHNRKFHFMHNFTEKAI